MAGGIDISTGAVASLAGIAAVLVTTGVTKQKVQLPNATAGPYNPSNRKATYSIVVPSQSISNGPNGTTDANGNVTFKTGVQASTMYVFDAMKVANHNRQLRLTKYPVQTGYDVSYNAVLRPFLITLEVAMSDAMAEFTSGMWVGNPSKSVSAYQTMQKLMENRVLLTLNTRLYTYTNMMLIDISAPDDCKTVAGLKMYLTFEQLFIGAVAVQTVSARPNTTGSTELGNVQPQPPTSSAINTSQLPNPQNGNIALPNLQAAYGNITGAGTWSSNPTSTIPSTLGAAK